MLVLITNRQSYLVSSMAPLHLSLSDIERQIQGHSHFEGL